MANIIKFGCTALLGTGKVGVIKPDEQGRYDIVVGGLNVWNSVGQYYTYEGARELFESSSQFMRRVKRNVLAGELGHPKLMPGMSQDDYARRVMSIYEDNICCRHTEIYLDFDNVKDEMGKPVIAIRSKLIPAGPKGDQLRLSLEDPNQNVCFSIRAFTDDYRDGGVTKRVLRTIVTWDQVLEPGLAIAEKYKSPALESMIETTFSRGELERSITKTEMAGMAQESSLLTAKELFTTLGWKAPNDGNRPHWLNW